MSKPNKKKAPEAIIKSTYSEKTDVWSFGITVIEILTRLAPYPGKSVVEVMTTVVNGELPVIEYPEWLTSKVKQFLIEKCFAVNGNQRTTFKVKKLDKNID